MAQASLGGVPFHIDPESVRWSFNIKEAKHDTLGGRVIQVFGTELGDMHVVGTFGRGDRSKGDESGWEAADRFLRQVRRWAEADVDRLEARPIRFLYPPRKWNFRVHVKAMNEVEHSNTNIAPRYALTLFIVEDGTGRIVRGIRDRYLERLMTGIGWEQTEYNGPTLEEVEERLSPHGGSAYEYFRQEFYDAVGPGTSGGAEGGAPVGGPEGLSAFMAAIRQVESTNNYQAYNSGSGAAGAYQYIASTWANYEGFASARDAPPQVQDRRAAADFSKYYEQHKDWRVVAAIHFSGQPYKPGDKGWGASDGNNTVAQYVGKVMTAMGVAP